eukprot:TRINITY_DN5462_c0_g3_i1.p1 TRINITY_DN5462_c0_g3~~TRINITY_DN5462_c0_g3_i1.p1  ORF type:complete len:331 (+),score=33.90 TRINITY_DN5462_c0_g3_i1:54-1046(+)
MTKAVSGLSALQSALLLQDGCTDNCSQQACRSAGDWRRDDEDEAATKLPIARGGALQECQRWRFQSKVDGTGFPTFQAPAIGIGGRVWPVSLVLGSVLQQRLPSIATSRRPLKVLELGCGCGLVGLSLARQGHSVVLTDIPALLPLMRANVAAAASKSVDVTRNSAAAAEAAWSEIAGTSKAVAPAWESLPDSGAVASDVLVWGDVADARRICNPDTVLVFAHANREDETAESVEETFEDTFESLGVLESVETIDPPELGAKPRQATVFAFRVRQGAASTLGLKKEDLSEADQDSDRPRDRSEMCTVCGGPISAVLRQRRGVCDPCMSEF